VELTGRTIVVTGGASGIGKAMAERFAMEAAQGVVVADLDQAKCDEVADGIAGAAIGVACDVTDEAQVNALIDRAEQEFGTVDIFCANAGIGLGSRLDASDEEWKQVMDVNVMAHVYAARCLVPGWLDRGEGYFVSTASAAGMLSQIGDVTYSVSKHGAVAFAEWLAITYGEKGIRVSCLCPMGVNTPLVQRGLDMDGERGLGAKIVAAAGNLLDPADVAKDVMAAIKDERFFILPHPVVGEFYRRKGDDHDRWLNGMRRLQARVEDAIAQASQQG
jgi:NAD(P)-dependent dehydrogenase (short-subunit alcohol dehydrogenase family)